MGQNLFVYGGNCLDADQCNPSNVSSYSESIETCVFGHFRGAQSGNQDYQNVLSTHAGRKYYQSHHCSPDGNDSFGKTGMTEMSYDIDLVFFLIKQTLVRKIPG